jgi:hypothetical protein
MTIKHIHVAGFSTCKGYIEAKTVISALHIHFPEHITVTVHECEYQGVRNIEEVV